MKFNNHTFDKRAISQAVLSKLRKYFPEAKHALALEIIAASHGFPSWNHMSAALEVNQFYVPDQSTDITLKHNPTLPVDWPIRFESGIHIIACRDGVSTEEVGDQAIQALISSSSARQLVERGYAWKMNYFLPNGLWVGDVYPNSEFEEPGYYGLESRVMPIHAVCQDQLIPMEILQGSKNLFRTRVFRDINSPSIARRCINEATKYPVILVISANDAASAMDRLAELHCPTQILLNPIMIRRIDVVEALEPKIVFSECLDGKYSTLLELIKGREVTLVEEGEEQVI